MSLIALARELSKKYAALPAERGLADEVSTLDVDAAREWRDKHLTKAEVRERFADDPHLLQRALALQKTGKTSFASLPASNCLA